MGEPYLALYTMQPATGALFVYVAELCAQPLHACEAARGLRLEILKIRKGGEEGCCTTRDLMYEVLLHRVGMVGEPFEEGKGVRQC